MKKIILFPAILFSIVFNTDAFNVTMTPCSTNSIDTSYPIKDYRFYKNKSSSLRSIGCVLITGGFVAGVVGFMKIAERGTEQYAYAITLSGDAPKSNKVKDGKNLIYAGVAMIAASIPLFIAGHRNKAKAKLSIQSQKTSSFILPQHASKYVDGITLTIPIGK